MESLGADVLVRKYEFHCLRIAGRWCRNDSVAHDLAQDVLARFIERETNPDQASFAAGKSIGAYLAVAIRNAYRDYVDAQQREAKRATVVSAGEVDAVESVPSDEMLPLDRLITAQQSMAVKRCLSDLPPEDRHLLTLRYLEDPSWTLQQIADELGLAVSTVKYRIDQILRTLRRMLKRAGVEGVFHAKDQ